MHGSLRISICTTEVGKSERWEKEQEMNLLQECFLCHPEGRGGTYIGYHWNVATLRDYGFHIAGSFGPEYGCNAIAYHLSDGLGGQHRITLGIIPAQL